MTVGKRLLFTFDLEDHRPDPTESANYSRITSELLDFFEARQITCTVFVLGKIVAEAPKLIRDIAKRGHEIGYHSYDHRHLTRETVETLRADLQSNKPALEDLIGAPVYGYRAPAFSLTPASAFAIELIREAGFTYSSSVLPARNPVFGFADAPREPFRWANGLIEIPAPVAHIGPAILPFLGGVYLRYLPAALIRRALYRGDARQCYWFYCHPHDFDYEESFYQIEGTSLLTSLILWFNRKRTFQKLDALIPADLTGAVALRELVDAFDVTDLPAYSPTLKLG